MIKGLAGGGGIRVLGGDTSVPYISMTNENPIQGMVRVWGSDLQVFDSTSWKTLPSSYATVTLDEYTLGLLDWAKKKKMEEEVLLSLPNDNPAVKIARQNVNRAKKELARAEEQLKITEILSQDDAV
jgi:hypothetical protein